MIMINNHARLYYHYNFILIGDPSLQSIVKAIVLHILGRYIFRYNPKYSDTKILTPIYYKDDNLKFDTI